MIVELARYRCRKFINCIIGLQKSFYKAEWFIESEVCEISLIRKFLLEDARVKGFNG